MRIVHCGVTCSFEVSLDCITRKIITIKIKDQCSKEVVIRCRSKVDLIVPSFEGEIIICHQRSGWCFYQTRTGLLLGKESVLGMKQNFYV